MGLVLTRKKKKKRVPIIIAYADIDDEQVLVTTPKGNAKIFETMEDAREKAGWLGTATCVDAMIVKDRIPLPKRILRKCETM